MGRGSPRRSLNNFVSRYEVFLILSLVEKEGFRNPPLLPREERYAPTQAERLAIQSVASFPVKTKN